MKTLVLLFCITTLTASCLHAQDPETEPSDSREIRGLVDTYSRAREQKDPILLSTILTDDTDQLVSSGVWRKGKAAAMEGMLQSSEANPGERTITIESIRFLTPDCAVADTRYTILNDDRGARNMWSCFLVVRSGSQWKIAGIRNMLPAKSGN